MNLNKVCRLRRQDTPPCYVTCSEDISEDFNPHCDLDHTQKSKTATKHSGHWWCTTAMFGCKRFKSSGDLEQLCFEDFSPALWPWPWRQNPNIFHDTVSHDNAPTYLVSLRNVEFFVLFCMTLGHEDAQPYQVSWTKVKWLRRYSPDKYSMKIWTLTVTLTLKTAI